MATAATEMAAGVRAAMVVGGGAGAAVGRGLAGGVGDLATEGLHGW